MPPIETHDHGPVYWRSLGHRSGSPEVMADLESEFADPVSLGRSGLPRRDFLRMMTAALAAAGLSLAGCRRWPEMEIRPHASQPEAMPPGVSHFYASIYELGGIATGILVKTFEGRPIKIEGSALHPFSLGAADAFMQASLLELYDPDRLRQPVESIPGGEQSVPRRWEDFTRFARAHFARLRTDSGKGLAVLSRAGGSPSLGRMREAFLNGFPRAAWHTYEPLHRDHEIAGARRAFGKALRTQYHLQQARVIACFDADLLGLHPAHQRFARDWASGRSVDDQGRMSRLYAAEGGFTITGSVADSRLPVRPSRIPLLLVDLAVELGLSLPIPEELEPRERQWIRQLALDLKAQRGASVVAVGSAQPDSAHQLAHAINHVLGNFSKTIRFSAEPIGDDPGCIESISQLAESVRAGHVTTLLILDGNPVYDAPAELNLDPSGVLSIHLSAYHNETSSKCRWTLPLAHFLECWGDGRAWNGLYSVQQPMLLPLFDGKAATELLAMLLGQTDTGLELVRETARRIGVTSQGDWERLLHDGLLADSSWPLVDPGAPAIASTGTDKVHEPTGLELIFAPDASVYDGRFAENGWLQEMPDPLTKLTWDNAAIIAPSDAQACGCAHGDIVRLEVDNPLAKIEIPVFVMPGQAPGVITLPLGYGRTRGGHIGRNVGVNVYALRTAKASYLIAGARLIVTGRKSLLATTQDHGLVDGIGKQGLEARVGGKGQSGHLIRDIPLPQFNANPGPSATEPPRAPQLFDPPSAFNDPHAWGMIIDLNKCIGCSACVLACQVENNIPIVGREQVSRKREMHWIRIDRYFKGLVEDPEVVFAPMTCSHCENAPCEQVCPVAATTHDTEGLNTMVYNRCIGTRYCSNNCPFKVRRFNYLDFHSNDPRGPARPYLGIPDQQQLQRVDPIRRMVFNPDVTVRMRGVMEKCTFCTQRLQAAKISAGLEFARGLRPDNRAREGEVVTACQGACPTQAIIFGDLNDSHSAVSRAWRDRRAYEMLEHLNLRARTRHLAKLRNPALPPASPGSSQDSKE